MENLTITYRCDDQVSTTICPRRWVTMEMNTIIIDIAPSKIKFCGKSDFTYGTDYYLIICRESTTYCHAVK